MPDFNIVPSPVFSPTRCVTCHSNFDRDGFLDLGVDDAANGYDPDGAAIHSDDGETPTFGRLYLCLTCLFQGANKAGCLAPEDKGMLVASLAAAEAQTIALQTELEAERANKVVSLDTVRELLKPKTKAGSAA